MIIATTSIKVTLEVSDGKFYKVNSAKSGSPISFFMYYNNKSFFIVLTNYGFNTESIKSLL